jgi:hypothetical protein
MVGIHEALKTRLPHGPDIFHCLGHRIDNVALLAVQRLDDERDARVPRQLRGHCHKFQNLFAREMVIETFLNLPGGARSKYKGFDSNPGRTIHCGFHVASQTRQVRAGAGDFHLRRYQQISGFHGEFSRGGHFVALPLTIRHFGLEQFLHVGFDIIPSGGAQHCCVFYGRAHA